MFLLTVVRTKATPPRCCVCYSLCRNACRRCSFIGVFDVVRERLLLRMVWSSSDRRSRLPSDWSVVRSRVLRRDGFVCQLQLVGCASVATEVDHIVRGDNHAEENLRAVCSRCHRIKTTSEAQEARRTKRALRFRPQPRHPGLC